MDSLQFKPSRRLGQNFLLDPSLHRVLVDAADPGPGDLVLEIGPGLGFLTRELAGRARTLAVEVDGRLHEIVSRELPGFPDGGASVRLLHCDALQGSRISPLVIEALAEERAVHDGRFLVVANLPYAISGPLLAELAYLPSPPDEMAVLVQLELAQRITALPGTKDYGAMTAWLQLAYQPSILRKVSAQVFRPRPQVDSAMLQLAPLKNGRCDLGDADRQGLSEFLRQALSGRRKKLRNTK
ncbi:MAG: 16S rRNA (adenine(1518)-N(6)/adenine(1519)-N(6))-dimethyltransferase RsmA, partial [Planctomycetota bacterium]|nr:16S rRNA (adenine(1518)-N(6)/adenine(1519)-N(6))-dimethyltransferase RsmA [Planctomycetota bacterium]